jgi:hypothetical protein
MVTKKQIKIPKKNNNIVQKAPAIWWELFYLLPSFFIICYTIFMKSNKKFFLFLLVIVIVGAVFAVVQAKTKKKNIRSFSSSSKEQDSKIFQTQVDYQKGLDAQDKVPAINGLLTPESLVQRPFAVVIENHPAARPQSGLSQADIVYEALAEGGITRYLALFQTQQVQQIGPVRSARTYFNDWAQELSAVYVHVGGNSDALYYLKQGIPGVSNADQYVNNNYIYRVPPRLPPHNTYTSSSNLFAMAKNDRFSPTKSYINYLFKDDAPSIQPSVSKISIDFSAPHYAVQWVYDSKSNTYKRFLSGSASVDANGNKNIYAKSVIIQRVKNWPVQSDTLLAISMGTREGGVADIYQDGKVIHGTWKVVNGRTKYLDSQGAEIALDRGQIWIEVVPPDRSVTAQ